MDYAQVAEQEEVGILFIYEADGKEWTEYMMKMLRNEPYKIQCLSTRCWDLNEDMTQRSMVLVLIFTPKMEKKYSSLNFDLLQPDSKHSCLIECNGQVSKTDMPEWRSMYTLEETAESQRAVLTGLIDMYEKVSGNEDSVNVDTDDVLIRDLIPAVLYPGQTEVYVIFNYEEKAEVSVAFEGLTERLDTRKYTKTVHVFDIPKGHTGQKYVNIFVGDQEDPIISTNIIILTAANIIESLTYNVRRILYSSNSNDLRTLSGASSIDPFSKTHCKDAVLKQFWSTIKELETSECKTEKPKFQIQDQVEDKPEVMKTEAEANEVHRRKPKKTNIFKNMFQKVFGNKSSVYDIKVQNRNSKRFLMAISRPMPKFPHLPSKRE